MAEVVNISGVDQSCATSPKVDAGPRDVLHIVTEIAAAKTIEDVWAITTDALARFHFDRINYGFTRFRNANSIGDHQDALFLTNHDQDFFRRFFGEGRFTKGPMYRWAAANVGACSWRWAQDRRREGKLKPEEIQALDENAAMGMVAGYTISFADVSVRTKGAMGLCAHPGLNQDQIDALWDIHGESIMAICNTAHLKAVQMPYKPMRRTLTERQREALEWVADGKTNRDIAILMGVSPAMIEKHLRLAREALDVETTAHAVAKASLMNQIFVVPQQSSYNSTS